MKKCRIVMPFVIIALAGTLHAGDPLTPEERDALIAHLDRTGAALQATVEGLTPEQWSYKPAADRWSIAENVEHLALSEAMLRDMTEQAMTEAAAEERLKDARKEQTVLTMVVDRSTRVKTFPPLEPTGRYATQEEALGAFQKERALTKKLALEGGDLRSFVMDHPVMKELDAYGNLMFASAHVERHIQQIEEVKASDGYPH